MSAGPVRVHFTLTDNFSGRLARAAEVAHQMHLSWTLRQATWEPHDWSTFS